MIEETTMQTPEIPPAPCGDEVLRVEHLKKYFPLPKKNLFARERPYLHANDDISIDIKMGETFGLVGESGCGKSTLLDCIIGYNDYKEGEWHFDFDKAITEINVSSKTKRIV